MMSLGLWNSLDYLGHMEFTGVGVYPRVYTCLNLVKIWLYRNLDDHR